jgi:hypothetical protein
MMMPQANPPGQLQPTNTTAAYQLHQDAAEKNYQAQLQQQNAMWGGLAGLGSAGVMAAPRLLGAGGPFAAGGVFGPAAAGAPFATAADAGTAAGLGTGGFNFLDAAAPAVASGATDALAGAAAPVAADAFAAGAPVAADLAATAAPAVADAAGMSIADLLPFLATMFV